MKYASARWALYVDIFEPDGAGMGYPVVRHVFYGLTKKEAQGYFDAHMTTDTFMADCVLRQRWKQLRCLPATKWRRLR